MLLIELKDSDENIKNAYNDNIKDYKDTIPKVFWYNCAIIISNGIETKIGSLNAGLEHYADWKKKNSESDKNEISLNTSISSFCEKKRFLDIVENFTVFLDVKNNLTKIVAKYHQYFGVQNALESLKKIKENKKKLGVFWHTQRSGKSLSMIFFSQKVLRKIKGNWSFVIVTDRNQLDDQIYRTFQSSKTVTEDNVQANNIKELRKLLKEDHRYIFTLIHKFQTKEGERHPILSERSDIIVITDEAHRTQYDTLAQNMRIALPNASFLGFTGTPLIKNEFQKTREVFGEYISIYNFKQAIKDKATVPIHYENRLPKVELSTYGEDCFNEEMNKIIEESLIDENEEVKLSRKFSNIEKIIRNKLRQKQIAINLIDHFLNRGFLGKAMYVAYNKPAAIEMFNAVKKLWMEKVKDLKKELKTSKGEEQKIILERIKFMKETDMAVVISQEQNEIEKMEKKGLDIKPHRKRMINEELDEKFKDPENKFRIVFVCAMWITGFDAPSCSTLYLDKPLKGHSLMQTIARVGTVFPDKINGLIVDYIGIFRNLESALSIYASGSDDDFSVLDKKILKDELIKIIKETTNFLLKIGIKIDDIIVEKDIEKRSLLKSQAVEIILSNNKNKKEFINLSNNIRRYLRAYLPSKLEQEYNGKAYIIKILAKTILNNENIIDISEGVRKTEQLIDQTIENVSIVEPVGGFEKYDLSKIDIEKIKSKFKKNKYTTILNLKTNLKKKIENLIKKNPTRIDYLEKLKKLMDKYNNPKSNIDDVFEELTSIVKNMKEEEQRFIREDLKNEEELAIFDLLTKPDINLNPDQKKHVKKIAVNLLNKLKEITTIDWKKTQQNKAIIKHTIQKKLDELPDIYTKNIYQAKCDKIYDYVYDADIL